MNNFFTHQMNLLSNSSQSNHILEIKERTIVRGGQGELRK